MYEDPSQKEWCVFLNTKYARTHVTLMFDIHSNITIFADQDELPFLIEKTICEIIHQLDLSLHIDCADLDMECNWDHFQRRALEKSDKYVYQSERSI